MSIALKFLKGNDKRSESVADEPKQVKGNKRQVVICKLLVKALMLPLLICSYKIF